jgi:hypothetical protein
MSLNVRNVKRHLILRKNSKSMRLIALQRKRGSVNLRVDSLTIIKKVKLERDKGKAINHICSPKIIWLLPMRMFVRAYVGGRHENCLRTVRI